MSPDRRAYLVLGPESSGNRFMVELLVEAGCAGRGDRAQPFDGPDFQITIPTPLPPRVALLRSLPHGGVWVDVARQILTLDEVYGYRTTVLVMVRDPEAVEKSQVAAGHVGSVGQARDHVRRAYRAIFAGLGATGIDYVHVIYQALGRPGYRRWLAARIDLAVVPSKAFVDGNLKYYDRDDLETGGYPCR